jgi:hypothetical protein
MAKTLSTIRATIRQMLRDEFAAGSDFKWEDDELDTQISECLAEISESLPYKAKETLTTTESSKELDISSIEDLLEVEKIEFRTGSEPPNYRNCSVFGNTLRMGIDFLPSADENVYLYCHKLHQLTESSSTLSPQVERLLVLGVVARAAIAKSQSHINKVNVGGGNTPSELQNWGLTKMALYQASLRRLAGPKTNRRYPTGTGGGNIWDNW